MSIEASISQIVTGIYDIIRFYARLNVMTYVSRPGTYKGLAADMEEDPEAEEFAERGAILSSYTYVMLSVVDELPVWPSTVP